jgi:hypothetical protein
VRLFRTDPCPEIFKNWPAADSNVVTSVLSFSCSQTAAVMIKDTPLTCASALCVATLIVVVLLEGLTDRSTALTMAAR